MSTPGAVDPVPPHGSQTPGGGPVGTERAGRRRRWPRRRVAVVGVVALVVLAAAGVGTWLATRPSASAAGLRVATETATVTTGTMRQTVAASGTIEPAQQADLSFAVSGQVTSVLVAAGDKVTAGQKLATVDPSALSDQVAAAKATLAAAQAQLASSQAAGASTSQIDSEQASVTSAQSQLTTAETDLADATLTSTMTGTVASVDLTVGQQVTGAGSSGAGSSGAGSDAAAASSGAEGDSDAGSSTGQVVVVATDSFAVTTTVDDTEIAQVKVGDQADITPSGSTSVVYGTVSSVGLIASESSTVASFPVDIAVTGTPSGLYAGATASVSIIVEQLDNVVEVPTAAISYTGGKATVTEVEGSRHVTQAITTGTTEDAETQVTSGLRAGDKVAYRAVTFKTAGGKSGRTLFGGGSGTGTRTRGSFGGGTGFGGGRFGGGGFGG